MNKIYFFFLFFSLVIFSQGNEDKKIIKQIFDVSMTSSSTYEMLDYLSNEIGPRLSGSLGAERAVEWGKEELSKMGFDKVWLQDVMVPKWVRGPKEFALIETQPGITFNVDVSALTLGIINLWSTSVLSAVYLNVTKVPSKIEILEKV